MTARIIGEGWTYRLQVLLPEDSWHLFEMTTFEKSNEQILNHVEMVDIGNRIVEKCNNVPLAIKVVGSLLFGEGISKWRSLEKSALAKIDNGDNKIVSVLKLSYYNLPSSLKRCFSYCAVFPKDFVVHKDVVISMWMAQGYIVPFNGDQSIEDAAEEHFSMLLRRCFFQDVVKDQLDCVISVKIHDFMHDVAQEVRGGDIQVINSDVKKFGDRTRHVSIVDAKCFKWSTCNWVNLRHLTSLPTGLQYLTSLQSLHLGRCEKLNEWISCFNTWISATAKLSNHFQKEYETSLPSKLWKLWGVIAAYKKDAENPMAMIGKKFNIFPKSYSKILRKRHSFG